jgi:FMN-dependent oxidoreductase (nitrilotriacetate monooxygenase family)
MPPSRPLHLAVNVVYDGTHPAAWRLPSSDPFGFVSPRQWRRVAELAERGTLDAIFMPDTPSLVVPPEAGPSLAFDSTTLLATVAGWTEHVGLVATSHTTWDQPYALARRLATLDHLSGGRAGWNVVTGYDPRAARNFGRGEQAPRAERYARATEFVEVVRAVWDSWEDEALIGDQACGRFADPERVHPVAHDGAHFAVAGAASMPRTPQGHPVVVQAGGSPQGLELAGRFAEVVFAAQSSRAGGVAFAEALRDRTEAQGRGRDAIRILVGLSTVIGSTEREARDRLRDLNELWGDDQVVAAVAGQLQVEPDAIAVDAPLPDWLLEDRSEAPASQGARDMMLDLARRERLTPRQLAERILNWHALVVGAPEQIADRIEDWSAAGAADGFVIIPDVIPDGLEAFVDHVVPILRARGLFRHEYAGTTLRDHLGLPRPTSRFAAARTAA